MGSVSNVIRQMFIWLDYAVYWLIDQMYSLFSLLTEASIFTQDQIQSFSNRIYVLVSIIMFFRLGFAFINYIINPDSFSDKQRGGGALIKKIVITMALLVSVPTIFNEAFYVQQLIFKNNIIDKVLLGDTTVQNEEANQHRAISTYAFLSFFKPSQSLSECQNYEGVAISPQCITALNSADDTGGNPGNAYKEALENYDLDLILKAEVVNSSGMSASAGSGDFFKADTFYLFDYNYPISTVVGGLIAWILLGFCLDLSIRIVKLGFLQIIAPIPIVLSLAPTQKNNTLGNWGKECVSTWVSLFVRVMVISFSLSTIMTINSGGGIFSFVTGGTNKFSIVTVFVMIGILLFAKEFPKLLEDILGIKGAGKMTFNALKRAIEIPGLGGLVGKGAAYASAGAHLAGNTLKNSILRGGEKLFADRKLGEEERLKNRQDRWNRRFNASFSEFEGRSHADPTKRYTGDTQSSLMHKQNLEQRKKVREQKQNDKFEQDMIEVGKDAKVKLDVANASLDKIAKGQEFDASDRKNVVDAFRNAYGSGHEKYAENAADLEIAKKKQDYLKSTVSELERLANANPTDTVVAERLREANKQLDGANKQVSGLEEKSKSIEVIDSGAASIAKGIKLAKAEGSVGKVDFGDIKASDITSMVNGVEVSNQNAANQANRQMQDAIVGAINQGFANMNNSNISGVNVTQNANGEYVTPGGIIVSSGATSQTSIKPGLTAADHAGDTPQQAAAAIKERGLGKEQPQPTGFSGTGAAGGRTQQPKPSGKNGQQ